VNLVNGNGDFVYSSALLHDCLYLYHNVFLTRARLKYSEVLQNLDAKVFHLKPDEQVMLFDVILYFGSLFSDMSSCTSEVTHDVDAGVSKPIKQWPYRMNPRKFELYFCIC